MIRILVMAVLAIGVFTALPGILSDYMQTNGYAETPQKQSAYGVSKPAAAPRSSPGRVVLKANRDGHFLTQAKINGKSIRVLVDTGATSLALSYEDAKKIGLRPRASDYTIKVNTANGVGKAAPVTVREIRIGRISESRISGLVAPKGALSVTLLGMSFLKKLKRFEIQQGKLILEN